MADTRNALMPYGVGPVNQLAVGQALLDGADYVWNGPEGYVNKSDGSVGIIGKALGTLGLDYEDRRANTSWEDALRNSFDPAPPGQQAALLPITSDGGYGVPGVIAGPAQAWNRMLESGYDPSSATPEQTEQMARDSFDAASLAPLGGLAVGAVPEGALAANTPRRIAAGHMPMSGPTPETARWMVDHYGSPEAALKKIAEENANYPDWMPGAKELKAGGDKLSEIIKSGLYSNARDAAAVPLATQLADRSAGVAGAVPEGAIAANGGGWLKRVFGTAEPAPVAQPLTMDVGQHPKLDWQINRDGPGAYHINRHDGEHLGSADVGWHGSTPYVGNVELLPNAKRQGIGSELYNTIESDLGRRLVPSPMGLSPEAKLFWKHRLESLPPNERAAVVDEAFAAGRDMGFPDAELSRRLSDLYSNSSDAAALPLATQHNSSLLAFQDYDEDHRNALMPFR